MLLASASYKIQKPTNATGAHADDFRTLNHNIPYMLTKSTTNDVQENPLMHA